MELNQQLPDHPTQLMGDGQAVPDSSPNHEHIQQLIHQQHHQAEMDRQVATMFAQQAAHGASSANPDHQHSSTQASPVQPPSAQSTRNLIDQQLEAVAKQQGQNEAVMSQLLYIGQQHGNQLMVGGGGGQQHSPLPPNLMEKVEHGDHSAHDSNLNTPHGSNLSTPHAMPMPSHDAGNLMHQQNEAMHNQMLVNASQSVTPQSEPGSMQQQPTAPGTSHAGDHQGQQQHPSQVLPNGQNVFDAGLLQSMPSSVPLNDAVLQELSGQPQPVHQHQQQQQLQQSPVTNQSQILSNPSSHTSTPHLNPQELNSQHATPEQQHEQIMHSLMPTVSHGMTPVDSDAAAMQQAHQVAAMQQAVAQHVTAQQMAAAQQNTPDMVYDGDMKQQQSSHLSNIMPVGDSQNYANNMMSSKEQQIPASHVVPSQMGTPMPSSAQDNMMQHVHVDPQHAHQNAQPYSAIPQNMMDSAQAVHMHSALMQQQQMQQLQHHIEAMQNSQVQQHVQQHPHQHQQQQQQQQQHMHQQEQMLQQQAQQAIEGQPHGTKRPLESNVTSPQQSRKSRRHTVSTPYPSHLNLGNKPNLYIDTASLQRQPPFVPIVPSQMGQSPTANHGASLPGSMANSPQETKYNNLGHINLPPRPTLSQMNLETQSTATLSRNIAQVAQVSVKEFEHMTREQLIARLVQLEQEKRGNSPGSNSAQSATTPTPSSLQQQQSAPLAEVSHADNTQQPESRGSNMDASVTDTSTNADDDDDGPNTPTDNNTTGTTNGVNLSSSQHDNDNKEDGDDEEVDEDDEEDGEEETPKEEQKMQCRWRDCGLVCDSLSSLISHIGEAHVGSGKASYSCDWEGCPRAQKPFTKRHKMYNHLRTHTGERPYVCPREECAKRFSRPDSLTTHIKTHSNVRPFVCTAKGCKKAYYHSRSLKKHERTHAGHETNQVGPPPSNNNLGYIPSPMDPAQAEAYGRFPPRPYLQSPYTAQPIPTPDKMNENQGYLGPPEQSPINVSQFGPMTPMNAYGQPGQSPGGQIYSPMVALKYNMPESQSSSPGGQQMQTPIPAQDYSGNNAGMPMNAGSQQPSQQQQQQQAYPFVNPVPMDQLQQQQQQQQQQQNAAYPPNNVQAANVASQFNYGQ